MNGWTALHWAAKRGYVDICKLLLAHGADTSIANKSNQLPVDVAFQNDAKLIQLLTKSDANSAIVDSANEEHHNQGRSSSDRESSPRIEHPATSSDGDVRLNSQDLTKGTWSESSNSVAKEADSMQPPPAIQVIPSYMSRVKPPTSMSSYSEEYTYPWTKPNTCKTSTPSSFAARNVQNGLPSSHHNSNLNQSNSVSHNINNGLSDQLRSHHLHASVLPDMSSSPGMFSSNESMPIASNEVQYYMDRKMTPQCRILKVRVSDQCDKDFVEIDLPLEKLSIQASHCLLSLMAF